MTTGRAIAGAGVVIALVTAYAGWRVWLRDATVPPDSALTEQCREVPATATRVVLTGAGGRELGGAVVGPESAPVGLVVRQGASQTICDWLPWAADVTHETGADERGVRVLLFDRRGAGSSPGEPGLAEEPGDTVAAAQWLREQGAENVLLMGSSMGNSVTLTALARVTPPVCGLISVSPVLRAGDASGTLDATAPAALPANLWVTWETGNAGVASAAESLTRPVAAAHTLPVETGDHSIDLVTRHAEVRAFLDEAVVSCAG